MEDVARAASSMRLTTSCAGGQEGCLSRWTRAASGFSDVEKQPEPGEPGPDHRQNIQYIAEKELDQAIHDTAGDCGHGDRENPAHREILALANRPTFNPNLRKQIHQAADQPCCELRV